MKNIITPIIVIIAAIGGSFIANMLKPAPAAAVEAGGDDHAEDSHDAGHGDDDYDKPSDSDNAFFDFSREFVIPLLSDGQVTSLVIINISLEVDPSLSSKLFGMEPKLRDNIMTSLISLTNDDKTFQELTTVRNYETIRSYVLSKLRESVSSEIINVLIMDIAKQDF